MNDVEEFECFYCGDFFTEEEYDSVIDGHDGQDYCSFTCEDHQIEQDENEDDWDDDDWDDEYDDDDEEEVD